MSVYAIMTKAHADGFDQFISHAYPDILRWSDTNWIISTTDSALEICKKLGVSDPTLAPVTSRYGHILVVQVTANYWGFGTAPFWDGLKAIFQRQAS